MCCLPLYLRPHERPDSHSHTVCLLLFAYFPQIVVLRNDTLPAYIRLSAIQALGRVAADIKGMPVVHALVRTFSFLNQACCGLAVGDFLCSYLLTRLVVCEETSSLPQTSGC